MRDILHRRGGPVEKPYTRDDGSADYERYMMSARAMDGYLRRYGPDDGRFGPKVVGLDDVAPTMCAHYAKDRKAILVKEEGYPRPRALTPRECARLMGFPDSFKLDPIHGYAYKQIGNSVIPQMIDAIFGAVSAVGQSRLV